jgi:hypothetical protein
MARSAFWRATGLGSVLQAAMVLLGLALPTLRQDNLYPIGGTLLALLAGVLFACWAPGATLPVALGKGALAGGISSWLGTVLAALTGQLPAPASTVLVASVTGCVAGSVGGFGLLLRRRPPPT